MMRQLTKQIFQDVRELQLKNLTSAVKIDAHRGIAGMVVVKTDEAQRITHTELEYHCEDGVLTIEARLKDQNERIINYAQLDVVDEANNLRIDICAPAGTNIALENCLGDFSIGALGGSLTASIIDGKLEAQEVTSLDLTLAGRARARVEFVRGEVKLAMYGSSDISVYAGEISELSALLTGASRTRIHTDVQDAHLTASAMSRTFIQHLHRTLDYTKSGIAVVEIGERD